MSAVVARVAGVEEVVLCTPPQRDGRQRPEMLVAADVAGVQRIFKVGGAQAIVAMAYGTETVPRVDKVLGPGNLFVVLAKRRVFGAVAIDQLPGPTETLVLADEFGRSGRGGRRPAGPGGARPPGHPAPADHLGGPGQRGAAAPSNASSNPSPPRPRPATPSA